MTSLGQYASGRTIECELLKATKIEGEIDLTELNTESVSLEDKWKIYLDENDSFIIKNEIQNVISLEADGLTGNVTIRGGGGGGGATNLTDLQDVCGVALNGQMFYYNQNADKYEFTNNIINDELNNKIIISSLNATEIDISDIVTHNLIATDLTHISDLTSTIIKSQEISANEMSCNILNYNTLSGGLITANEINTADISTQLFTIDNGGAFSDTIFNYSNMGANYIRGQNLDIDVFVIHLNGTHNGVEIINNSNNTAATFFNKNNTGENEINGKTTIGDLFSSTIDVSELSANEISCNILSCENIHLTGNINGGSIINIDPAAHGDETGLVVIRGGLQVDGSSTIINSSIVDISDIAILLASNAPNLSATDGAGIDVSGGASFKYKYSSGAFDTGYWESNIDLSCDLINTQNIHSDGNLFISAPIFVVQNSPTNYVQLNHQNLGTNYITGIRNWISSISDAIHLDAFGTGHNSGIRIKNRGFTTTDTDTIFNYDNSGENYIRGRVNYITSFDDGIYLDASGATGANSGVQIVNGAGGNGSTIFNYNNAGENYIRGTKLDVVVPEIILTAEKTIGVNDGFINLWAQGTGTNSGVQIRNGVGNNTIFNYQNSASNFIHGTSRFFNDIHIQRLIDASNSTGNYGAVLMSEGTGTNKWSNNPSLPNYLYMGGVNVGLSGQVLVSQHTGGFPTWASLPVVNSKVYSRIKTPINQSIANNSLVSNYDVANAVTSATGLVSQTTAFTAPRNGDYFIHAHVTALASNFNNAENKLSVMRIVRIRNGIETNIMQSNHLSGQQRNHSVSTIETLQENDTLAIRMFNDSGQNITIASFNSSALLLVKNVD